MARNLIYNYFLLAFLFSVHHVLSYWFSLVASKFCKISVNERGIETRFGNKLNVAA